MVQSIIAPACRSLQAPDTIGGSCPVEICGRSLGGRSTVGHGALDAVIGVRIPASQPFASVREFFRRVTPSTRGNSLRILSLSLICRSIRNLAEAPGMNCQSRGCMRIMPVVTLIGAGIGAACGQNAPQPGESTIVGG